MKAIFSLFISLSVLFTLLSGSVQAQENKGSISGTILEQGSKNPVIGAKITLKDSQKKSQTTHTDQTGVFKFENLIPGTYEIVVSAPGYSSKTQKNIAVKAGTNTKIDLQLSPEPVKIELISEEKDIAPTTYDNRSKKTGMPNSVGGMAYTTYDPSHNTESYSPIDENGFRNPTINPLSTFSVDVDAASYSNVRRFILNGQKPPADAVRVEEMINYFDYDYPNPSDEHPFSITTEFGDCPWNKETRLIHIGLQGKRIDTEDLPASNLVFLLDVSGSMNQANKLPLLIKSFQLLVNELGEKDRIAIVVYAGAAGVVLESTSADQKTKILESLESLRAGGSTAGGEGIILAYKVAQDNFIKGGNNRIILATDGDFNVGMSSDGEMKKLIEEKRESGIFLTCLGFGMGNYKDSKLETLADAGNGNYAYIDNILEAKKVLVTEIGATLLTLAKDVKIQVEFNPNVVESYRLVGYENRLLNEEDFNDDKKDAGEIGAGHSVTALYEVVLRGSKADTLRPDIDDLRYQNIDPNNAAYGSEILTVKFRYKEPDGDVSKLIEKNMKNKQDSWKNLSYDFKFSACVASFAMLLRDSKFKGTATFDTVLELAKESKGADLNGYRAEFIRIVELAKSIYQSK